MYLAIRDSLLGCDIADVDDQTQRANEQIRNIEQEIATLRRAPQTQQQQQMMTIAPRAEQSRKRDFASFSLSSPSGILQGNPAKSRRTTPQPYRSGYSSVADRENSPIDLTGDDVDEILRGVRDRTREHQHRVEETNRLRREQEARDRELAIQLSNPQQEHEYENDDYDRDFLLGDFGSSRAPTGGLQTHGNSHSLGNAPDPPISIRSYDEQSWSSWWGLDLTSNAPLGNITPGLPGSYPHDRPDSVPRPNPFTTARSLLQQPMSGAPFDSDWMMRTVSHADFALDANAHGSGMGQAYPTFSTAIADDIQNLLSNIGDADIPPEKREGTPEGLHHALYPHQQVALSWMKKAEDGTNKGGILADDMGLGKTISTTALMLARPSPNPKTKVQMDIACSCLYCQP
jgi:hypothetical protein